MEAWTLSPEKAALCGLFRLLPVEIVRLVLAAFLPCVLEKNISIDNNR